MLFTKNEDFEQKVDNFLDRLSILKYGSIAFSIINLIDLLTTVIGLDLGLSENNFPMYVLIELFKEPGFIVVKVVVSIGILFPLLLLYKKKSVHAKAVLVGVGIGSIIIFLRILIAVIINTHLILETIY